MSTNPFKLRASNFLKFGPRPKLCIWGAVCVWAMTWVGASIWGRKMYQRRIPQTISEPLQKGFWPVRSAVNFRGGWKPYQTKGGPKPRFRRCVLERRNWLDNYQTCLEASLTIGIESGNHTIPQAPLDESTTRPRFYRNDQTLYAERGRSLRNSNKELPSSTEPEKKVSSKRNTKTTKTAKKTKIRNSGIASERSLHVKELGVVNTYPHNPYPLD